MTIPNPAIFHDIKGHKKKAGLNFSHNLLNRSQKSKNITFYSFLSLKRFYSQANFKLINSLKIGQFLSHSYFPRYYGPDKESDSKFLA